MNFSKKDLVMKHKFTKKQQLNHKDTRNRFKKGIVLSLATSLLLSALILSGCGSNDADGTPTVNIGYFNNVTHIQALYMKSQGMLEEAYGDTAQVEWTAFNAGPAEVEALFSESIDIGYIGPFPAINANVKSEGDIRVVSAATQGGAVLIARAGSGIESVDDLDGKNVAIPQIGNTQHLTLLALLDEYGLKDKSTGGTVNICAISNADVANCMNRGDIDAALVPEPWGATLLAQGAALVLDYDEIMGGDYDVAVIVVRKEFYEQFPEIVETFLEQHELATEEINANIEESLTIINNEIHASTGKLLTDEIITEAFTRIAISSEINKASIQAFGEISEKQGLIHEAPTDTELYVK